MSTSSSLSRFCLIFVLQEQIKQTARSFKQERQKGDYCQHNKERDSKWIFYLPMVGKLVVEKPLICMYDPAGRFLFVFVGYNTLTNITSTTFRLHTEGSCSQFCLILLCLLVRQHQIVSIERDSGKNSSIGGTLKSQKRLSSTYSCNVFF